MSSFNFINKKLVFNASHFQQLCKFILLHKLDWGHRTFPSEFHDLSDCLLPLGHWVPLDLFDLCFGTFMLSVQDWPKFWVNLLFPLLDLAWMLMFGGAMARFNSLVGWFGSLRLRWRLFTLDQWFLIYYTFERLLNYDWTSLLTARRGLLFKIDPAILKIPRNNCFVYVSLHSRFSSF